MSNREAPRHSNHKRMLNSDQSASATSSAGIIVAQTIDVRVYHRASGMTSASAGARDIRIATRV